MNSQPQHDRSLGELLGDLASQTSRLVRQEVDLARVEIAEKTEPVKVSAGAFAGAAVLGLGAFGALTATLILVIALAVPAWLAALVVTLAYGCTAGVLARIGLQRFKRARVSKLPQTTQTIKDDVEWVKAQTKSVKKSSKPAPR